MPSLQLETFSSVNSIWEAASLIIPNFGPYATIDKIKCLTYIFDNRGEERVTVYCSTKPLHERSKIIAEIPRSEKIRELEHNEYYSLNNDQLRIRRI